MGTFWLILVALKFWGNQEILDSPPLLTSKETSLELLLFARQVSLP